jgi:hypothetical protein
MEIKLDKEEERCLTIKKEALIRLLKLFEEDLKARNYTIRNGKDINDCAKTVAQRFSEIYPRISSIFEGNPKDCGKFFHIFTEEQEALLRSFFKTIPLILILKPFKEAAMEYIESCFGLFKNRLVFKGFSEKEINEAWNENMNYYKKIIEENTVYIARIGSLRIKESKEKGFSSDPLFLTSLMAFELEISSPQYQRLREGLFKESVESVEEVLKTLVEKEWFEDELEESFYEEDLNGLWQDKRNQIIKLIEDLFDAIDSTVRKRLEFEYFKDLIKLADKELPHLKGTIQKLERNLKILDELYDEGYSELGNILVEVIPVGFKFENKITDYHAEKDFRYFLYTYKLKINDIAEGVITNHLEKLGKVNPKKVKTRKDFFLNQGKLFVEILNKLEKEGSVENGLLKKLPSYLLGFLKAYFYYATADKETLKELYEDYQRLKELDTQRLNESDLTFLRELKKKVERLRPKLDDKSSNKFEKLYNTIADKLLKQFLEKVLAESYKELFVAVDFSSLAGEVKKILENQPLPLKTQLYRGILKVLTEKRELKHFAYIFRVKNIFYNYGLDLDKEISPQIKYLKPIKDWENFFNATAELSEEVLNNKKQSFKFAFILTYIILLAKIASESNGLLLGFSLPHSPNGRENYSVENTRDLIYKILTAVSFALSSDKIVAIQNFNWKDVNPQEQDKVKNLKKSINNKINKLINPKLKNGLTSLFSNLPFEVEGLNLYRRTAVLAISHPITVDKNQQRIIGEAYIFEPVGPRKDLFTPPERGKVYRKTFMSDRSINYTPGDIKGLESAYKEILKEVVRQLKVKKIYLIAPLPLYRGLSTKEDFLKELYFGDLLSRIGEELKVPIKLVFSSFGVVYTPNLENFVKRLENFIKSRHKDSQKEKKNKIISANLFKNIEKVIPQGSAIPLVIPKFAIIPFFSMEKDKKSLFHHAFIYSVPNHRLFEGVKPENILLNEEEKHELANLLSVIHLIQYQKGDEIKTSSNKRKGWEKTFKRNPFLVFPERRSGDKNILSLTEIEIFFNKDTRPKLQTVLLAFELWKTLKEA